MILGLHGLPGSGKDTFANSLIENGPWAKVSFAGPIKRGISAMFNIPMEDIENPIIKNEENYKFGKSIRYMAQTLGTEWGRHLIADDIWLQLGVEAIDHYLAKGLHVVNTDLRFTNEALAIKSKGGVIIHIIRNDNKFGDMAVTSGAPEHISNARLPLDMIDTVLYNNGTLEDFEHNVNRIVTSIALDKPLDKEYGG